jgi:hypothetical protein
LIGLISKEIDVSIVNQSSATMGSFLPIVAYVAFATLAGLLLQVQGIEEVACWAPDGITIAPNDSFVPCNKLGITQVGIYSSCCQLDGDAQLRDLCASSGLCVNQGIVRREYCTDKTWQSPACVKVCNDPSVGSITCHFIPGEPWLTQNVKSQSGGVANGSMEMTPCTDGSYCCGHNNLTCCGTQWAVRVTQQAVVAMSNATVTAVVTQTPGAMPGTAAIAGLGGALGLVVLAAVGVIIWLKRQNANLKKKNESLAATAAPNLEPFRPMSYMPSSSAPTMVAPSSHVPSMQDFAAFKSMYENVIAYQSAQEMAHNPSRLSELDANTAAAARQFRLSTLPPFEQIRETAVEHVEGHETTLPPPGAESGGGVHETHDGSPPAFQ